LKDGLLAKHFATQSEYKAHINIEKWLPTFGLLAQEFATQSEYKAHIIPSY
jgi:hypothetical protein